MLYRVVTHTIKEEMMNQPPADSEFSAQGWYPTGPTGPMPTRPSAFIPNASPFNTESGIALRMESRTAWARYLWRMRAYLLSALNSGEDLAYVEERLFKDIDEIGDMLKPYYGLVASKQMSQLMRSFVLTEIEIVKALRAKQDISMLRTKHLAAVDEFASFLNTANPKNWPKETVKNIFEALLNYWQTEAIARVNKDWATDIRAVDDGHRLILAGSNSTPAFADIFARGVIAQFPDRFTS